MFALPFVFVIFIVNFQAGLILYWITTNVWTIGQQLMVKKLYPKPEPLDPRDAVPEQKPARGKPATAAAVVADGDSSGKAKAKAKPQAAGKAQASGGGNGGPTKAPPGSPRKKKKRSGRRR
jgi:YidC/Oxa1 family membrane protein insertase